MVVEDALVVLVYLLVVEGDTLLVVREVDVLELVEVVVEGARGELVYWLVRVADILLVEMVVVVVEVVVDV